MILNYLWIGLILSFINIIIRIGVFKMEELEQPEGSNGLQYFLGMILIDLGKRTLDLFGPDLKKKIKYFKS